MAKLEKELNWTIHPLNLIYYFFGDIMGMGDVKMSSFWTVLRVEPLQYLLARSPHNVLFNLK
jgi:hypothetical protein